MKIILKEDVRHLGRAGDVIDVKDGYARNYLIPRQIAAHADTANMKRLDHERRMLLAHREKQRKEALKTVDAIDGVTLVFEVQTGEYDKMFGSITTHDIERKLEEMGKSVERRLLGLDSPIRSVGGYRVPVHLLSDVQAQLRVWVLPTAD